jgi:L-fucose mutarotase
MLKGLHPLLGPELLHALAAMGHGDEIGVVDAHFPAAALGRQVIRLDGVSAPAVLEALLTLLPLDDFVDHAVTTMAVVGAPSAEPEVAAEFGALASRAEGRAVARQALPREQFYERARQAFALVQCGERRLYGNVLLRKGVVAP